MFMDFLDWANVSKHNESEKSWIINDVTDFEDISDCNSI